MAMRNELFPPVVQPLSRRRVLLSFIGKGQISEGKETRYKTTNYRAPDGSVWETSIFGWALSQYFRERGEEFDVWLVVGTPESMWDQFVFQALDLDPDAVPDGLCEEVTSKVGSGSVTVEDLSRIADFAPALKVKMLQPILVGYCDNPDSQRELFTLLLNNLQPGDLVTLDITHAFRHMPFLASYALITMHWLKGVSLEGVYYGALDMIRYQPDGTAPVIDLSLCATYAQLTSALATFRTTGSYRSFQTHFEELADEIDRTGFLEDINNLPEARKGAERIIRYFETDSPSDPLAGAVAKELAEALSWANEGLYTHRMLGRAEFLRSRGEYLKSIVLVCEAMLIHTAQRMVHNLDICRYDDKMREEARKTLRSNLEGAERKTLRALFKLRNCLVHAAAPQGQKSADVMRARADRKALEQILDEGIELARKVLGLAPN